ncbi:IS3 family transposase [Peribacillus alkalitolerans]|uniref:IS3 family transposase n=1 Tax=Peribacillus alkalitolerans TaxID=1550385 RepID=UPI001F0883D7|nr:IS3 family transposase [Peribacillus alkalitolerans]
MLTKQEEFEFIATFGEQFTVSILLKIVNRVSKSGYYKWRKHKDSYIRPIRDQELFHLIFEVFAHSKGTYGKKRIRLALLKQYGLVINLKCIARIMRKYGLVCKCRQPRFKRRKQPHGTISNVLDRQFTSDAMGKKFCIDITYIEVKKPGRRWIYLCAIKDLFNNEVVAYNISQQQDMKLVLETIQQLKEKGFEKGAILHSDQGHHFTNPSYISTLANLGLTQSMSRRGNCWDNASIENFFGHLKCEMPCFSSPQTVEEVQAALVEYINYYNEERIQNKHGMSPVEYRTHAA